VGPDEDDSCVGSKSVYGRSGKSTAGDVGVIRHGSSAAVVISVVGAVVFFAETAMLECVDMGDVYVGSRFEFVVLVGTPDAGISEELLKEEGGRCGGGHDASWSDISRAFIHSWMAR